MVEPTIRCCERESAILRAASGALCVLESNQDFRDTMTQVSAKAEHLEGNLRPDRLIENSPIGASCLAGALGFVIGSRAHPSTVGPTIIFALLGYRS